MRAVVDVEQDDVEVTCLARKDIAHVADNDGHARVVERPAPDRRKLSTSESLDGGDLFDDSHARVGVDHVEHPAERGAEAESSDQYALRVGRPGFGQVACREPPEREFRLESGARKEHEVAADELVDAGVLAQHEASGPIVDRARGPRHVDHHTPPFAGSG